MFAHHQENPTPADDESLIPKPVLDGSNDQEVAKSGRSVTFDDTGTERSTNFEETGMEKTGATTVEDSVAGESDQKQKTKKVIKILTEEEVREQCQKMLYKINSYCIPCIKNKFLSIPESQEIDVEQFAKDMEFREALLYIRNSYTNALRNQPIDLRNALRNDIAEALIDGEIMPIYKKILDMFFKLDFVDADGKLLKKYFNPVAHVMITLFNFTDKSKVFTKAVCNTPGLLEIIVWFLRESREKHFTKEMETQVDKIVKASLSTLYNCSRVSENRQRLLEVGSFEAALPYLDSRFQSYQMSALFCVAYLSDEERSHVFAARKHLLEKLVNNLSAAMNKEDRQYNGWSALELIMGIDVLARNDANKRLVVECGAFDVLLTAMKRADLPREQYESMKSIWSLCFDKDNKALIAENTDAMEWFETIAESPEHQCRKMAKGILWTVTQLSAFEPGNTVVFDSLAAKRRPSTATIEDVKHIMISYQWNVQPLMIKIKDQLKSNGYKVWMDVEHMQGSTLSAMADAIEQASVVLIAMSHKYKNSQNCRVEGEYAFTKGKIIIPLIVEPKYKPDGWLGLILGAKLYYNFCGKHPFETVMANLIRGLGGLGKLGRDRRPSISITPESSFKVTKEYAASPQQIPTPQAKFEKSCPPPAVVEWDSVKVEKWMDENGINKSQVGKLTGQHLMFLQEMKKSAPDFYYKYIRRLFTGKLPIEELDALSSFSAALENL